MVGPGRAASPTRGFYGAGVVMLRVELENRSTGQILKSGAEAKLFT